MYTYDVPGQPHGRFVLLAASSLSLHFFQRTGIGGESKTGVLVEESVLLAAKGTQFVWDTMK